MSAGCTSRNSDKSKKRSHSPAGSRRRRKRTHAIGVHPLPPAVLSVTILLAAQDCAVVEGGNAPVSPCVPLCAIFLRKPRVYPLSSVKANVGHLCEKLKNAMRNGWGQRCDGNFGIVKECAVGKHPKSEKLGGIGSGCRLRLRPLPVLRRRQSQRVARIDPNAVVVDKNIAENDRFDLFSR